MLSIDNPWFVPQLYLLVGTTCALAALAGFWAQACPPADARPSLP
ncbi:hypothetical protein [Nitrogeniibacter mangrovi]|nr:hypothetical protein [Nitrogeniibacter mangrovi]